MEKGIRLSWISPERSAALTTGNRSELVQKSFMDTV